MSDLTNENIEKAIEDLEEIAKGNDSEEVKDENKKEKDNGGEVKKGSESEEIKKGEGGEKKPETEIEKALEASPLLKGFTSTVQKSISDLTSTIQKSHDNQKKFNEKTIEIVKGLKEEVTLMKGQIDEFGDQDAGGQKSKTEIHERSFSKGHGDDEDDEDGQEITKAEVQAELDDMVKANELDVVTATSFELNGILSPELQGRVQERIMKKAHDGKKLKITG